MAPVALVNKVVDGATETHGRRSENTDLIVEISLQPWHSYRPDGVILFRCERRSFVFQVPFAPLLGVQRCIWQCLSLPWLRSDILTPLAALGVPFDIDDTKGPLIEDTVRTMEEVRKEDT